MKASVKVMRSYDYCHFEVALSSDQEMMLDEVNDLRKQAAVLCDEAVRQYKEAKSAESKRQTREWEIEQALSKIKRIKEKPSGDLTPEEAALLRASEDNDFWKEMHQDDYYYNSDPEREYHFSMLTRFKDARVLG